jgi:predicted transport protein
MNIERLVNYTLIGYKRERNIVSWTSKSNLLNLGKEIWNNSLTIPKEKDRIVKEIKHIIV